MNRTFAQIMTATLLIAVTGFAGCQEQLSTRPDSVAGGRCFPDLNWQPRSFEFKPDPQARYIDFDQGDDSNPGTRESPWKHHPWDRNATAMAAASRGVHTYVFRRGVVYYGALTARESGSPGNPIRLTSDPAWGRGEAVLSGAVALRGGWRLCSPEDAPMIPPGSREKTWYRDISKGFAPRRLWEVNGEKLIRIPIARTPDWKVVDPDDPRSQWWELTGYILEVEVKVDSIRGFRQGDRITGTGKWVDMDETRDNIRKGNNRVLKVGADFLLLESWAWRKGEIKPGAIITNGHARTRVRHVSGTHQLIRRLVDTRNLTNPDPDYYKGAIMRAEREMMPSPKLERVLAYNPTEHSLRINFHLGLGSGPHTFDRYYLEDLPQFLDSPGEYYYQGKGANAGRLFLRLPQDRNPNQALVEAAKHKILINIHNQSHIEISGLQLRVNNMMDLEDDARHAPLYCALVMLRGTCNNISIRNCHLRAGSVGIVATPENKHDRLDRIAVTDNDIHDIDGSAAALWNGCRHYAMKRLGARLLHVRILRNRVRNTGYLSRAHWGIGGENAISVHGGEVVEVAYNHVDRVWGAGVIVFTGSDYSCGHVERPFLRTMIHHNKVTNSLLGLQDYGGIAAWMGGPAYVYNNISGNPVGYKHANHRRLFEKEGRRDWYRTSCYGVGIYLDGQYKGYAFNNLCWGRNNDVNARIYNSCAFNEAMGFMNQVFNNTFYNFGVGLHKGMTQHNRCYYLGNLMLGIGHKFIQQEPRQTCIEYDSLAWAKNVFHGTPPNFGRLGSEVFSTLAEWRKVMREKRTMVPDAGTLAADNPVRNMQAHDFRPAAGGSAIDHGVRVFVPWALSAVVGEWHFLKHPADPAVILGESIYVNDEWIEREMFQDIPRCNLRAQKTGAGDFINGALEDWTQGALAFNGKDRYCVLKHADMFRNYKWGPTRRGKRGAFTGSKRKTVDMDTNSFLIETVFRTVPGHTGGGLACKKNKVGYSLFINANGKAELSLNFVDTACSLPGMVTINDGKWHHLIAEVDRARKRISLYVDGKSAGSQVFATMPDKASLANTGDFLVGKTQAGAFFAGAIDFLRISRGTLADAETSIDELYKWEFNGPFLRDFYGSKPTGLRRDAGALELEEK